MLIQEGIQNWTAPERSKSSNHGARRLFFLENDFLCKRIRNAPTRLHQLDSVLGCSHQDSVRETRLGIMVQVQDVSSVKTVNT